MIGNRENILEIAIVTLHNPAKNVLCNIKSYLPYIKELLIVDNSTVPIDLSQLKEYNTKITILSSDKNLGIARSLNLALEYAKSNGYKWIMTMDQDSYFEEEEIKNILKNFNNINQKKLAIFSPLHNKNFILKETNTFIEKDFVMTSGNILNVEKSFFVGGFDENLFIDEVDHEFCLRLQQNNYAIIQDHSCYLNHTLGEKHRYKNINLYKPERIYYMVRNYLYIRKKYKKNFPKIFITRDIYLLKFFIKQFIYSERKKDYLKLFFLGIKDFLSYKMGYRVKL